MPFDCPPSPHPTANLQQMFSLNHMKVTSCIFKVFLTIVLKTLCLKLILSVYPVKKRGTYDGGDGQPADLKSKEQGIPLSRFTVGRPESDLFKADSEEE